MFIRCVFTCIALHVYRVDLNTDRNVNLHSFSHTDSIRDDVAQEAFFRDKPGSLVTVLEVQRLQGLQEMSTQKLEADVHLLYM